MTARELPTVAYIRSILDYDPHTGVFTWKYRHDQDARWNTRYSGKRAGSFNGDYWVIRINAKFYKAHRLAWLLATGNWPQQQLDHRDCDKLNNRISNLRPATGYENTRNTGIYSNNTSGVKGVSWRKNRSRWVARITVDCRVIFLGMFKEKSDAEMAVIAARAQLHGDFARQA